MKSNRFVASFASVLVLLSACGGDGAGPAAVPDPVPPPPPPRVYAGASPGNSDSLWNYCETPRPGVIVNSQGTQADEKGFIRAFTAETYLWNKEVPDVDPTIYPTVVEYFDALKTPLLGASGRPKDRFHFSYPDATWNALSAGVELGYGLSWQTAPGNKVPRAWRVAVVEADSPAAAAGVRRGDQLIMIDGADFINLKDTASVAAFNAALFPKLAGEPHTLTFERDGAELDVRMSGAKVVARPVQNTRVIDTPTGKVGYLTFNDHSGAAEQQLIDAIGTFRAAQVSDLVIDMRYNGGGLVTVASELAYMIAGAASNGKIFMQNSTNGRLNPGRPTPFSARAAGLLAAHPAKAGQALPHLDLKRVTVLTGAGTCSASEALINGLRGIDVQVDLVGGQTCGKPFAFIPAPNCGTTYFMVQFRGTNDKGWGDFDDGFAPTCAADDDMGHALGDSDEGLLAQALRLRAGQACAAPARLAARQGGRSDAVAPAADAATVPSRMPLKEIAILPAK